MVGQAWCVVDAGGGRSRLADAATGNDGVNVAGGGNLSPQSPRMLVRVDGGRREWLGAHGRGGGVAGGRGDEVGLTVVAGRGGGG